MNNPSTRQVISISTGTILRTLGILIAIGVLWEIRDILLYIFSAILLAGLMYPFAQWASKHRVPKGLAVIIFYIVLFSVLGLIFSMVIPVVLDQSQNLATTFGGSSGWFVDTVNSLRNLIARPNFFQAVSSNVSGLGGQLGSFFREVGGVLVNIFGGIVGVLVVLVLSFYLIAEDSAIRNLFRNFVPVEYQDLLSGMAWRVMDKLGGWLRGQLILGLVIGVLYFIGFSIIGVPYALLLAILGGLLEFIPYAGPFISAVPAVFLAVTDSPLRGLMTLILILIIQQMEAHFIVPKVMQKTVGLNPIISIIAFLTGFKLFGIVGAIFAIPIATAISVVLSEWMRFRREDKTSA